MRTTTSSDRPRIAVGRRRFAAGLAALLAASATVVRPTPARALTLDEARANGLVGERPDGYLGVVRDTGGVAAFVAEINARRQQEYQRLATQNGVPRAVVEQQAGQRLIRELPAGRYYMTSTGTWAQK